MKIKKIKPLLNHIVTTANVYESSEVLLDSNKEEGQFKEYQTVVSVGPNVSNLKEGDIVVINPAAYARPIHKQKEDSVSGLMGDTVEMIVQFPIIDIDGVPHLFLYDRDVEFIIEEMEDDTSVLDDPINVI